MSTEATVDRPIERRLVPVPKPAPIVITPHSATSANPEGVHIQPILHAARRRWAISLFLGIILCGGALAAAWTLQKPKYEAAALLRVYAHNPRLVFDTADGTASGNYKIEMGTQQQLVVAPFVLSKALRDEQIAGLPVLRDQSDPIGWLQNNLDVTFPGNGVIMRVSLKAESPVASMAIVNGVVDAYLKEAVEGDRVQRMDRLQNLQKVHADAVEDMRSKRSQLKDYADTLGMSNSETLSTAQQAKVQHFAMLQQELTRVELELMRAESELQFMMAAQVGAVAADTQVPQETDVAGSTTPEPPEGAANDGSDTRPATPRAQISDEELDLLVSADRETIQLQEEIKRLNELISVWTERVTAERAGRENRRHRAELAAAQSKLSQRRHQIETVELQRRQAQLDHQQLLASRDPLLPPLPPVDSDAFQKELEAQQQNVLVLQRHREELARKVNQLEEEMKSLGRSSVEIEMMRAGISNSEDVLRNVAAEMDRTEIELNSSPRVKLLSEAKSASPPDKRKRLAVSAAAGLCGLFAPLCLLVLHDYRKKHVNDARSVIESLDTTHLGSVPRVPARLLKRQRSSKSRRYQQWQNRLLESVDSIASLLIRNAQLDGQRIIQVSSPATGEGKSTLATQLARSLARSGHRTLLADFDLRRPTLHAAFGFDLQPGVAEVLNGSIAVEKAIMETAEPQLNVLTAGCRQEKIFSGSSAGLLKSLFQTLRQDYEFVIVDSCPILPVVDARVVGQYVDGVVLSLVKDVSKLPQAITACEIMKSHGIRVIGTVVTGCYQDDLYYSDSRRYLT